MIFCCKEFIEHTLTHDDEQFIGYTADWEEEQGFKIAGGIYGDRSIIIKFCPFCGSKL